MKRLFSLISLISAVLCLTFVSSAEDENLLLNYNTISWEGAELEYNADHGTLSFTEKKDEKPLSASVTFPAENSDSLWFYVDFGNYQNSGTGYVSLEYLSGDGSIIKSYETEKDIGDGSFHRYQLGLEKEYTVFPEGTDKIRITLSCENGTTPYFRNLSLILSSTKTKSTAEPEWKVSGKLQLVQVNIPKSQYWIWTAIIVLVPIIMYITRKLMDKAKKLK